MSSIHVIQNSTNYSKLLKKFQLNGLLVRQDALTLFEQEFECGQPPYKSLDEFISLLMATFLQIDCDELVIDLDTAQKAIDVLRESRRNLTTNQQSLQDEIIIRNVDVVSEFGALNSGESNFKYQYNQLLKSLKKLPAFASGQFKLMTIHDIKDYDSSVELKCIVFAMIRHDPSRIMQYLLEDPTGKIPVTFSSHTVFREWATIQNGIYLIEGSYVDERDLFVITSIGLAPPIHSILPEKNDRQDEEKQEKSDEENEDNNPMIILLADIHLDQRETIEALKLLFSGYNSLSEVPDLFILIGNFSSKVIDKFDLKDLMKQLVKTISTFKKLVQNSRFVFVPGPDDPTDSVESFVKNQFNAEHFPTTTNKLKHYNLTSNPFHVRINNRNICLFANNVFEKYIKNTINSSEPLNRIKVAKNDPEMMEQFFKTIAKLILTNVHLTSGLNRNYINSLSLFPKVPDLLLIFDQNFHQHHLECQPFKQQSSAQVATLTSFSKDSFQFLVFYCKSNQLEESQI